VRVLEVLAHDSTGNSGKEDGSESKAFEQLVVQSREGDPEALMELCRTIAKGVLFRTKRRVQNRMDAEDVAQEVLIRICEKIHELREPKAFFGWLNKIIINEANRTIMKTSKHNNELDIQEHIDVKSEEDESCLPQEYILNGDRRKLVMKMIDELPEKQSEAVMLHYYDELNITETAEVMGVSIARASQCLSLAREKIKKELDKVGGPAVVMAGVPVLPFDSGLSQLLKAEAGQMTAADAVWVESAIGKCQTVVNGKTTIAAQAGKAAATGKGPVLAVAGLVAAIGIGAVALYSTFTDPVIEEKAPVVADGTIFFAGSDSDSEYINPTQAKPDVRSDRGDLTVISWQITTMNGASVYYQGEGAPVTGVFEEMRANGQEGEYMLAFTLEDREGNVYRVGHSFFIRN